jgi:hypothetical protein
MTPAQSDQSSENTVAGQVVNQRKEREWTITEWSDGAKTFSLPTRCVEELRTDQQNQTVELPLS